MVNELNRFAFLLGSQLGIGQGGYIANRYLQLIQSLDPNDPRVPFSGTYSR